MKISVKTLDSQTKVFTVSEEVSNALLFDIYTFILHTYISFMVFRVSLPSPKKYATLFYLMFIRLFYTRTFLSWYFGRFFVELKWSLNWYF